MNSTFLGSVINRVYAIGAENQYSLLSEEKWPKLEEDSATGNYSLTGSSGDQVIFDSGGLMIARKARSGRTVTYEYTGGKLSKILYPENVWMEFVYDANGMLQVVKDSSGRETSIVTDVDRNIKEVIYPDTTKREFDYDSRGLMVLDKHGDAVKSYTWDADWPVLTKITLPNTGERNLDTPILNYLLNGRSSSYDSPLDFPADSSGHDGLTSVTVDEAGIEKKNVVGKGWKSVYINNKLKEKTYFADAGRNRIPYKIEKGDTAWETASIFYNDQLLIREIEVRNTDAKWNYGGGSIQYGPDTQMNIVKHATFEYTPENWLYRAVEKEGLKVFTYDTKGNVTRTDETYYNTKPHIVTDFTYDSQDDLTLIEYMDGKTQEMVYDGKGLLQTFTKNDGNEITVSRNNRGEIISTTDEENRTVTIERDIMGRVTKETSPSGRDVQYVWGNTGCSSCGSDVKLTKIIDSGNKEWEFKYDIMGNVTEMIYPDASKLLQEYDLAGRLVKFTNKRAQIIRYQYDNDGRLQKKITPEGETTYSYDPRDRVSEISADDYHYQYQYGHLDQYGNTALHEENLLNGQYVHTLFNYFGFPRNTYIHSAGNDWSRTIDYLGNETTVLSPFGGPLGVSDSYVKTGATSNFWTNYGYDDMLRLERKNTSMGQDDYSYDTNGVLSGINSSSGNFPVHLNVTRDKSGLITEISGDKQLIASYNSDLETTNVQHGTPMPFDETYTYDARGNRLTSLTQGYTYDDLNRLTETTTHTYLYDADGNLTEEKNKLTTETKKYYYSSESRLITYEHYATDISPVDITAEYKYDLYGRRIQKTVNGTVTNFLWDRDNLAMEMDGSGQPIRRYFYGVGMDDYDGHLEFAEVVDWNSNKDGKYYYQKDQVGTIYKVVSQKDSQVVDSRAYDVFGNIVSQTGTPKTPLGFQGKYYDQESGLYYFYNRYYNPVNGRFMNEDPIGLSDGPNMYKFAINNPVNFVDPKGLNVYTGILKVGWGIALAEPSPGGEIAMAVITVGVGLAALTDALFFGKTRQERAGDDEIYQEARKYRNH
ncbi:MAG: RHS repeat-associated core domain-containing protein, partial [bacterium]|nr:RHS repeat-associated core domain-containing protein [bacterium]